MFLQPTLAVSAGKTIECSFVFVKKFSAFHKRGASVHLFKQAKRATSGGAPV